MKKTLACSNCGKKLAEISEQGIQSYGFGIKIEKGAYDEDLAWAVCKSCSSETPFNAEMLKKILKQQKKK